MNEYVTMHIADKWCRLFELIGEISGQAEIEALEPGV